MKLYFEVVGRDGGLSRKEPLGPTNCLVMFYLLKESVLCLCKQTWDDLQIASERKLRCNYQCAIAQCNLYWIRYISSSNQLIVQWPWTTYYDDKTSVKLKDGALEAHLKKDRNLKLFHARHVECDLIKHFAAFCRHFVLSSPKKVKNTHFCSKMG